MPDIYDKPVFICGIKKSGTTLLLAMLDNHPELLVYPVESAFFRVFLPLISNRNLEEKVALARGHLLPYPEMISQIARNMSHNKETGTENSSWLLYARMCEKLYNRMNRDGIRHDGDLLAASIAVYGEISGQFRDSCTRWVEKTPGNEHYADTIFEWWPAAKCIHLVRDPQDIFASVSRKHPGIRPVSFARAWSESTRVGFNNQQKYGKKQYMMFHYEDMVERVDESLKKISEFLEISENESLRTPSLCGIPWEGNSMFGDKFSGISNAPTKNRGSDLSVAERRVIGIIAGNAMRKMDYPVEFNGTGQASLTVLCHGISVIKRKFMALSGITV